ncbi:hypothetical protein V6N13_134064 [Hibiscus sabdariffa]|uniref:Uncharacterized protein n=1 Tax=Hibiscus sabdariffa TaxID=183260 RepID=A0ABR2QZG4_9ROSI
MATGILRPTVVSRLVYSDRCGFPCRRSFPRSCSHKLLFYYWSRVAPTGEVTWFFVLHGVALAVPEKMKLHWAVSGDLWWPPLFGCFYGVRRLLQVDGYFEGSAASILITINCTTTIYLTR